MEEREDRELLGPDCMATDLGDADLAAEQGLGRPPAQGADDLRVDQLDLLEQERLTGVHFVGLGGDTKEVKAGVWQGSSLPRLPRHPFHGAPKRKPSEIPATLVK